MKTRFILFLVIVFTFSFSFSQTKEDLKQQKDVVQAEVDKYKAKADSIQAIIDALPGWRTGAFGVIGGSLSNFSNWYAQGAPNNSSGNIGFTLNAFANKIEKKYFWRNSLNLNLNWTKLDNKDIDTDSDDFEPTTDVFSLTSVYGRKLNEKWAISSLLEYRTTLLNNFNDPGYLDLGLGATWTPIENLVVVINPINYNFVFADEDVIFDSSLGAKIVADYTKQIGKINFKSNLSAFQSYEDSNLSNWTWINSFSYTFWKNIGVGFDFGLRNNKQEALNFFRNNAPNPDPNATFDSIDNDLQTYYTIGLSYNF